MRASWQIVGFLLLMVIYATNALPICWRMKEPRICKQCVKPKQKCSNFGREEFNLASYTSDVAKPFVGKPCNTAKPANKWITCIPIIPKSKLPSTYYMISSHGFEYMDSRGASFDDLDMMRLTKFMDKGIKNKKKKKDELSRKQMGAPWRFKSAVKFFVPGFTKLEEVDAVVNQQLFEAGNIDELNKRVVDTYSDKKPYADHYAKWGEEFEAISGIYRVYINPANKKERVHLELLADLPPSTHERPLSLVDLVEFLDSMGPAPIYWNACRDKTRETYSETTSTKDLFEHSQPISGQLLIRWRDEREERQKKIYFAKTAETEQKMKRLIADFEKYHLNEYRKNQQLFEQLTEMLNDLKDDLLWPLNELRKKKVEPTKWNIINLIYEEKKLQIMMKTIYRQQSLEAEEAVKDSKTKSNAQQGIYNIYGGRLAQRYHDVVSGKKQEIGDKDKLIEYEELMSILKEMSK